MSPETHDFITGMAASMLATALLIVFLVWFVALSIALWRRIDKRKYYHPAKTTIITIACSPITAAFAYVAAVATAAVFVMLGYGLAWLINGLQHVNRFFLSFFI